MATLALLLADLGQLNIMPGMKLSMLVIYLILEEKLTDGTIYYGSNQEQLHTAVAS